MYSRVIVLKHQILTQFPKIWHFRSLAGAGWFSPLYFTLIVMLYLKTLFF